MKSFIKAITIIIIVALIQTTAATAQITPAPAPAPASAPAPTLESKLGDLNKKLIQLNIATSGNSGDGKVLVIPTEQIKPQDIVTLMEDMTVMCRIFNKKLAQSNLIPGMPFMTGMRFPGSFSLDSQSMRAIYVQGYGALFMTTVDFPLSPPPQTEEQEKTEAEDSDPVWEQVKQEIFLPQGITKGVPVQPEEKYDPKKVENLKTTLIKSLVHAANIRGLKPDELVVFTVTGSGVSSNVDKVVAIAGHNQVMVHYKDKNATKLLNSPLLSDLGISSPTVLTIRAKKSYIDALAQNKIDYEEFEEKIQLLSYPCLGDNLSRDSSPSIWLGGTTGYSLPSSTSVDITEGGSSNRRRSSGR